jgi:hypothetical protein
MLASVTPKTERTEATHLPFIGAEWVPFVFTSFRHGHQEHSHGATA